MRSEGARLFCAILLYFVLVWVCWGLGPTYISATPSGSSGTHLTSALCSIASKARQSAGSHSGPLVCGAEPRARCGFHLVQLASHDTQLKSGQDGIKTCSYCDHHGGLTHPFVPHRWLRCRTLGYFLFCVGFCGICLGWSLLIPLDDWRGHKRLVLGLVLLLLFSALATHIGIGILID